MTNLLWHELKEWLSHPVRICLESPELVFYGILGEVTYSHCTVDLSETPPVVISGKVRVEFVSANHLLRFVTQGDMDPNDPRLVRLVTTDQIEVVQRRQHVRIAVDLPVWVQALAPDQAPDSVAAPLPNVATPHARSINLSVGGLAIRTTVPCSVGNAMKLTIGVDDHITITDVLASVARCQLQSDGTWFVALRFEQPSLEVVAVLSQLVLRASEAAPASEHFGRVLHIQ